MERLKQGLLGGTMMGLAAGGLIVLARAGQGVAFDAIVVFLVFVLLLGLLLIVNSRAAGVRTAAADAAPKHPDIRTIAVADLKGALADGLADFMAMPTHLAFLCLIYPVVTFVAARTFAGYDMVPVVFPLLAGYTLVGPLVATGMYELSRRRELGLDCSRRHAFDVLKFRSIRAIATLGIALMVIYFAWLGAAQIIYAINFGTASPASIADFTLKVFTTPAGWTLITVGCGVGFIFAAVVFTLSVVSFPLLMDRDVGVMMAMKTSIRAVLANPVTMAVWGIIVGATLLIGTAPFFVGLAVALPVLGHATWHVYRKVVAW
jgi:uncharacterized membrane protein